jgi:hypothetical protein
MHDIQKPIQDEGRPKPGTEGGVGIDVCVC